MSTDGEAMEVEKLEEKDDKLTGGGDESSNASSSSGTSVTFSDDDDDDDKGMDSAEANKLLLEATSLKEMGNNHFKEKELDSAARAYRKGANKLKKLNKQNTGDAQVKALLIALYTNSSMVLFQQKKYRLSVDMASHALKVVESNANGQDGGDDNNKNMHVKGLYRRAVAQRQLGNSAEAKRDLQLAVKLQPQNKNVRKEYQLLQTETVRSKQQQQEQLRKAFAGSSFLYDDKEKSNGSKDGSSPASKTDEELLAQRKKAWEDECVSRMARSEPAVSFDEWEGEQKKKEKEELDRKRKEREEARKRREAERKKNSDADDSDDDDELTESELAMMRGYKKTKDGRTTSYFTREISQEEKSRLNIAPQKLETPKNDSSPQRISTSTSSSSVTRPSAWNQAGTWEEKDTTTWCHDTLSSRLGQVQTVVDAAASSSSYLVTVTEVKELTGDASFAICNSKKRYIFDFHGKVEYQIKDSGAGDEGKVLAKGTLRLPDICSTTPHDQVEVAFDAGWTTKPPSNVIATTDELLEIRKALTLAIQNKVKVWVEEFNQHY